MKCSRKIGQSVPHVHVHILPRHPGDFEPVDQVYDALEKVDISTDQHRAAGREGTTSGPHGKQQGKAVKMDSERSNVRTKRFSVACHCASRGKMLTLSKSLDSAHMKRWKTKQSG